MDFPNPLRAQCAQCGMEHNDGRLELIVGSEAMRNILKPKEGTIREAIAENFRLSTPPNLAIIVREGYNKPKTPTIIPKRQAPEREPEQQEIEIPEPEPTPEPVQEPEPKKEEPPIDPEWAAIGTPVEDQDDW